MSQLERWAVNRENRGVLRKREVVFPESVLRVGGIDMNTDTSCVGFLLIALRHH